MQGIWHRLRPPIYRRKTSPSFSLAFPCLCLLIQLSSILSASSTRWIYLPTLWEKVLATNCTPRRLRLGHYVRWPLLGQYVSLREEGRGFAPWLLVLERELKSSTCRRDERLSTSYWPRKPLSYGAHSTSRRVHAIAFSEVEYPHSTSLSTLSSL